MDKFIKIEGARVNNLKNINAQIPRNSLCVITGLSGSGKSSIAFNTLYAEGQRRYIDTFSAYARHFIGNIERPDVDDITGLSPVIAIEQKTTNKNPRSTVGTVTEISDFLRLLFARAADAYSWQSGKKMVRYTDEKILSIILKEYDSKAIYLLAPLVKNRKGHYRDLFESYRKKGFLNMRVDGELIEITPGLKLDRYKNHDIELVVDKIIVNSADTQRISKSVSLTMDIAQGTMLIIERKTNNARYLSRHLMDPDTGLSYNEPAPHNFSFNTPKGACPHCNGLGVTNKIDIDKIIPDKNLSISKGAIVPLGKESNTLIFKQIAAIGQRWDFTLQTPIKDICQDGLDEILYGCAENLIINTISGSDGYIASYRYEGLIHYIKIQQESGNEEEQNWADSFCTPSVCPHCNGTRLNNEALSYRLNDKNIAQLSDMQLDELIVWLEKTLVSLPERKRTIGGEIIKEIATRLQFLINVGLGYLTLSRATATLSGGESQRIRLATQIGSQLINVLYILDEPSIGLHQTDNIRLINSLKNLRDLGNSVIVVEHDKDMMLAADWIIDMGPGAGRLGGNILYQGNLDGLLKSDSITGQYLSGKKEIPIPTTRRKGNGKKIRLTGCTGNNLKNITLEIPLGTLTCVAGVSGSGKSSLIINTLRPILSEHFYNSNIKPLPYEKIEGLENIDKVVTVNQEPIGRTPRSNPATYTGIFSDIRAIFCEMPEAKIRAYRPGRFSFNTKGGRCEECSGNGMKKIEMNFLPDVYVCCPACQGKRYNRETLEVKFKGKSIADVLNMTINQAVEFFENMPNFLYKLQMLQRVGLGYIKLGQSSTTLSGGESQRIKLATELSKKETSNTLYILDEPTTGLHFEDIKILISVLQDLVDKGNTVLIIEHNTDVLNQADYLIDMGPGAGKNGGEIVAAGTPEAVVKRGTSATAPFLLK